MKLFLIHCGYYDSEISDGLFESHTNIFIAADSFESAREKAKKSQLFQKYRMHVDGIQQINTVQGFEIKLVENPDFNSKSDILTNRHRDLAPKSHIIS